MTWRLLLLLIYMYVLLCYGYETGAPLKSCRDMTPGHETNPQKLPSPFILSASLQSENSIAVKLNHPQNDDFEGFLIQARHKNGTIINGQFSTNEISQHRDCMRGQGNSLTHINSESKRNLHTEWTPPPDFQGEVIFRATVAKNFHTFWVGVESEPITITSSNRNVPKSKKKTQVNLYSECDKSRGCFGLPNDCLAKSDCTLLLSYIPKEDSIEFELIGALGSSAGWVGMAFSDDGKMGEDAVTECIFSEKTVILQQSWNAAGTPNNNQRINNPQGNIFETSKSYNEGVLNCKWKQKYQMTMKGKTFDLMKEKYHLLLAKGLVNQHGIKQMHAQELSSLSKVNLTAISVVQGKPSLLVKIHGSFMVASWIGLVSIGILLARYYKQVWEGSTLCKSKIWFAYHRAIMCLSVSLIIAAFVAIFIHEDGWSEVSDNPHPILGCVTVGLVIIQLIAGLLRPNHTSSQRQVFNWLHWLNGNCVQIIAVITIFFAIQLREVDLPQYCYWILIGFIGFHLIFHLTMQLHTCFMDRKDKNELKMHQLGQKREMETVRDAPGGGFRRFMLGIYIVVTLGVVAALILTICLH